MEMREDEVGEVGRASSESLRDWTDPRLVTKGLLVRQRGCWL